MTLHAVLFLKFLPRHKDTRRVVQVEGYATAGNDLSADSLLAVQRAKLVAQQLHDDGVSGDRIRQTPRAPSTTEASAVGSRRVEIELVSP
jgi:outer membrane protein OmpA-like peptidoglycan-associated protein